jgi:inner membrane protein YidH
MTPEPDPRFLLANERTFLAWTRTSLAIGVAAMAVAGLGPDTEPAWVRGSISVTLALLSVALITWAVRRYEATDRAIRAGAPLPRLHRAPLIGLAVAFLVVLSVSALLVGTHG